MRKPFRCRLPGILITVLLIVALIMFMAILINTKLLPGKLLLLAGVIFLMFAILIAVLTGDSRRVGSMIVGCLLTSLLLITLMLGTSYLIQAVDTLDGITGVKVEIAHVNVYVKTDHEAQEVADLSGDTFGILETLDRKNTDKAIADLEKELGTVKVQGYEGLGELVDSLLAGETEAILVNGAYLELLADMEGYETAAEQLRQIYSYQAESFIESVLDSLTGKDDDWSILDLFGGNDKDTDGGDGSDAFSMYISGIDSRTGLIAKSRSDVNIVATINPKTRQMLLVSTPRDFYVPLPISNGEPDKLTHAGIYGIDVSIGTLEMLYDTEIDYYFRVNFSGFEQIVDALGGITVNSPQSFTSIDGYQFTEGKNHVDGKAALSFARERYAFASGDRQRGKNQMEVIRAVMDKALSPALLKNYADIMESVSGSFETSIPYDVLAELVRNQLNDGGSWNIVSYSVDGTGDSKKPYSLSTKAYVMIPNQETVDTAIAMMKQVKDGQILEK